MDSNTLDPVVEIFPGKTCRKSCWDSNLLQQKMPVISLNWLPTSSQFKKNWEFHLAQQSANGFKNVFGPKFFGFLSKTPRLECPLLGHKPNSCNKQAKTVDHPHHITFLSKPPLFWLVFPYLLVDENQQTPRIFGRCKYQYYRAQCACPESQLEVTWILKICFRVVGCEASF